MCKHNNIDFVMLNVEKIVQSCRGVYLVDVSQVPPSYNKKEKVSLGNVAL